MSVTQTDPRHTPEGINGTLREVLTAYVGQPASLSIHDYGARKRSQVAGEIAEATAGGVLLIRARGAGREFVSYMDLYAGHIEVATPADLAEDMADALGRLGVHHREHRTQEDGRFGARPPVGPTPREGFHHVKTLVG